MKNGIYLIHNEAMHKLKTPSPSGGFIEAWSYTSQGCAYTNTNEEYNNRHYQIRKQPVVFKLPEMHKEKLCGVLN